ncbi:dihydroorotate dehydrogenase [Acetobacterium woodii]|uniref:Dihydroorotate dehydrogenase n=1 Tax=Acetobacterium woodii (strain ATCC 29683 / DSM 1030 / JCM 2381 / KCTC 1655 / WB1) TaxID=931626 RepID=H6LH64_ACEWD|nr:dihydroorotate dehydrogenase [Acetobacterium woodii]AFA48402.1 dihydroorotate dehydrogenase PyrD [Acetobacterium woodii DSM 1030]
MSECLTTKFNDILFKNPVIPASGTFGFGREYEAFYDLAKLGGLCSKGLTLEPKAGNKGLRLWETPAGLMNSIGLENPGIDAFINNEWPHLKELDTVTIVNVGGKDEESYLTAIEKLNAIDIKLIELNISCPNVKAGGMAYGIKAETAADITKKVVEISRHPIMVKLSPNGEALVDIALACEAAGAQGISLINTLLGMAIDYKKKAAVFDNQYAGLSGPAVKPIALRMTHQVCQAVDIPVMAMGGISNWEDALEFIMAGATCIQVGTINFNNPMAPIDIIAGLEAYCVREKLDNIDQIRGII